MPRGYTAKMAVAASMCGFVRLRWWSAIYRLADRSMRELLAAIAEIDLTIPNAVFGEWPQEAFIAKIRHRLCDKGSRLSCCSKLNHLSIRVAVLVPAPI